MYLFFDISPLGKPKNWKAPASDTFSWPRMIHLAWLMYNEERELVAQANHVIKPESFEEIPIEIENRYKVSYARAQDEGVALSDALMDFAEQIEDAKYVVAHNMNLNEKVISAEYHRVGMRHSLEYADKYCLMQEATWFCKIPGSDGRYKWPQLQDIHVKLFQARYANAGDAYADVAVAALSFFGLLDLEAIELF